VRVKSAEWALHLPFESASATECELTLTAERSIGAALGRTHRRLGVAARSERAEPAAWSESAGAVAEGVMAAAVRSIMFGEWAVVREAAERAVEGGTEWARSWCFACAQVSSAQSAESVGVGGVARAVGVWWPGARVVGDSECDWFGSVPSVGVRGLSLYRARFARAREPRGTRHSADVGSYYRTRSG